jgi:hypothetical protein
MEVKNINVRIPVHIYEKLIRYHDRDKPHLSLNGIIVEAVDERVDRDGENGAVRDTRRSYQA